MGNSMWMVRAGRRGVLAEDFATLSCVAIGWRKLGDLSRVRGRDEISELVRQAYPEVSPGQVSAKAGQIARFLLDFKIGDLVTTYDPDERCYHVGKIAGDYEHKPEAIEGYAHARRVTWERKVNRDDLSTATKNSLGALMTIFLIGADARAELEGELGKKPVGPVVKPDKIADLRADAEERGRSFITDCVSELDWKEMQELVAGILRAMGYKTRVSPDGPDRGRDILASPDGLGLSQPRIIVEVKHRRGTRIDAQSIRSFLGGRRPGDNGMYVSTGGFAKDAKYEMDRANIPVAAVDMEGLVDLLIQHYPSMDAETRALVPLVPIYWPAK